MTTRSLLAAAAVALFALPLVACASEEAPAQQEGYVQVEKVVTADEAAAIQKHYDENPFACLKNHALCVTPLNDGKVLVQQNCMITGDNCCY